MRIRKSPSPAVADMRGRSTEDLRGEYELLARQRAAGFTDPAYVVDQNDLVRELERRGQQI